MLHDMIVFKLKIQEAGIQQWREGHTLEMLLLQRLSQLWCGNGHALSLAFVGC